MSDELCPPPVDDDDLTLPRASINKMIKELVSRKLNHFFMFICFYYLNFSILPGPQYPCSERESRVDHELLHGVHPPDQLGGK